MGWKQPGETQKMYHIKLKAYPWVSGLGFLKYLSNRDAHLMHYAKMISNILYHLNTKYCIFKCEIWLNIENDCSAGTSHFLSHNITSNSVQWLIQQHKFVKCSQNKLTHMLDVKMLRMNVKSDFNFMPSELK